ncbi:uncharacterized protein LOC121544523 isoform X1 [Coregonus clupeaformis]|uniref:uncharacterized protein LOC121544523 isoform X1 n=1 Tax=Coregonus clupeaformis TaxID=59861 RepID=UPI001BE02432|nr:uncharacterized protein LOC121544523 isoform X1 [Coregonus clupeaformis]
MHAVNGLLLISVGLSYGLENSCDARKFGGQCYGALGGTVYLQLIINASGYELEFKNNITGTKVFKLENGKVTTNPPLKHRAVFYVEDGMLMLSNTEKADYGKYNLNIYNLEGTLLNTTQLDLLLFTEAPVSPPQLSSECLSHGEMRVTCSFEGDSPQYSWTLDGQTLDGQTLNGMEAFLSDMTDTVILKKGVVGTLACTVKNHISNVTITQEISLCRPTGPWVNVFVYFQLAEVFFLLTVCLGSYCFYKKKTCPQAQDDDE